MNAARNVCIGFGLTVALCCAGCGTSPTNSPPASVPRLALSPESVSQAVGQQAELVLTMTEITPPVFAISLQIRFDDALLEYAGAEPAAGGFFGSDALFFHRAENSVVHLAATQVQNHAATVGSGDLCRLRFNGLAAGVSRLEIVPEVLRFYDARGASIVVSGLETGSATLTFH